MIKKILKRVLNTKIVYLLFLAELFAVQFTGAYFTNSGTSSGNAFSAKCWMSPIAPVLSSPTNNSATNATSLVFNWTASTSTCSIATFTYKLHVFSDIGLTSPAYTSGSFSSSLTDTLPATVSEGDYWWNVEVIDQYSNTSTSSAFKVTVDRTLPSAALEITGSGYKSIEEKIVNGGFETGDTTGYTTVGNVSVLASDSVTNMASGGTYTVTPYGGSYMARVGRTNNYVWQNRLMQSFDSGAKSLSLYYNFFSRDVGAFDDPGFFIRVNGQEVFNRKTADVNPGDVVDSKARITDWQEFTYNLSHITDTKTNVAIYAGNTGDTTNNSWVYVDKITTYVATAKGTADYQFTGTDNVGGAGIYNCSYSTDGGTIWIGITSGTGLPILTVAGTYTLTYKCIDNAGNESATSIVKVITDTVAPNDVVDLGVSGTTENTATLMWTAPGNDGAIGRPSEYDVRYSTSAITDDITFSAATRVSGVPVPQMAGSTEILEVSGLDPGTLYYFAVKTYDEAPNLSSLSNVPTGTMSAGATVNPGDIVINELMWSGTSLSATDEWIELKNTTGRVLNLDNFVLTRWNGTSDVTMVTIPAGKTISANGYFLISNFADTASHLLNDTTVDVEDVGVNLSNTALSIKLYTAGAVLLDSAWTQASPKEGILSAASGRYYSMERTSVPGDGTNELNWYTCIDAASHTDFFEGVSDERGTPRAQNRSENEPLSRASKLIAREGIATNFDDVDLIVAPSREIPATPSAHITIDADMHDASFTVENISEYSSLTYTLSYDTDNAQQGVIGTVDLDNVDTYSKSNITLGSCSSGGVCVYYAGIINMKLSIELQKRSGETNNLVTE